MTISHLSGPLRKQKFTLTGSKGHGLWFVIGVFWSVLCVSVFQGSLLLNFGVCVFSCFQSFSSQFFYLLYTEIWQVASLDSKGESIRSQQHLILQLLLVIATFIWQARIGCYMVYGLINVEEKPKIPKRVRQRRSWVIPKSCKMTNK